MSVESSSVELRPSRRSRAVLLRSTAPRMSLMSTPAGIVVRMVSSVRSRSMSAPIVLLACSPAQPSRPKDASRPIPTSAHTVSVPANAPTPPAVSAQPSSVPRSARPAPDVVTDAPRIETPSPASPPSKITVEACRNGCAADERACEAHERSCPRGAPCAHRNCVGDRLGCDARCEATP